MNCKDIESFYNQYKRSLSTVANINRSMLKESYSYEKYLKTLRRMSNHMRTVFKDGEKAYDTVIGELVRNPAVLDDELADMFLTHVDFFINEGHRDYGVTIPVLQVLMPYFEMNHNDRRVLDCAYFTGVSLMYEQRFEEACIYFSKALSLAKRVDAPELYYKFRIMCAAFFRLQCYANRRDQGQEMLMHFYEVALQIWTDNPPEELLTAKKLATVPSMMRSIIIHASYHMLDAGKRIYEDVLTLVEEEWNYQQSLPQEDRNDCVVEIFRAKLALSKGEITQKAYEEILIKRYHQENDHFGLCFTYGKWDVIRLFDDETPDEVFEITELFFMNRSFAYVYFLIPELLKMQPEKEILDDCYHDVHRYFLELPALQPDGFIDGYLTRILSKCMEYNESEDYCIRLMQNLLVHRQTATAIHSTMVGNLAIQIADALLQSHPELFVGVLDLDHVDAVTEHADDIIDFIFKAGLCHDVGKLICTAVINLQLRKIVDDEFAEIRQHPDYGYSLLANSKTLARYANIAVGHHRSYDGKSGYPRTFDNTKASDKVVIDLISICDSIDAATDTLGRNYANPKTFLTVFDELQAMRGSRYSAQLVDAMSENIAMLQDIDRYLREERGHVQYEVYRQFVEPDTQFMQEDEKYIRRCRREDLREVSTICGIPFLSARATFERCNDFCYVITDGRDIVYGIAFCKDIDETSLYLEEIFVAEEERRKGYGSMLLEYVEGVAHLAGYKRMYLPNNVKGHFDKFGWTNGYSACEQRKYLGKDI